MSEIKVNKISPANPANPIEMEGDVTFSSGLPNFTGMIAAFGTPSAPSGWLECDGDAVSRTTYERLFDAIGTTWGSGDGSTTFNLPDMREVAPVGIGTRGAGAASDVFTLGQFKDDQMQKITGSFQLRQGMIQSTGGSMSSSGTDGRTTQVNTTDGDRNLSFDSANSPDARTGTVTRGKRIGTLYCIKF